jgi:hypothetical protein
MGAPALYGTYTSDSAIPEIQGMNVFQRTGIFLPSTPPRPSNEFDFIELPIDMTQPYVVSNFGGVSGGGLWRVYFYRGADGQIQNFKVLDGVAYWQTDDIWGLAVRCHGPQSIGTIIRHLYGLS